MHAIPTPVVLKQCMLNPTTHAHVALKSEQQAEITTCLCCVVDALCLDEVEHEPRRDTLPDDVDEEVGQGHAPDVRVLQDLGWLTGRGADVFRFKLCKENFVSLPCTHSGGLEREKGRHRRMHPLSKKVMKVAAAGDPNTLNRTPI